MGATPIVLEMRRSTIVGVRWAVTLAVTVALGACGHGPTISSGTDPIPAASSVVSTPPPMPGGRSCTNPSPLRPVAHGLEVQGAMRGGGVFSALFSDVDTLTAGTPITTYWRIGGARALQIVLVGPADRIVPVSGVRPGVAPFTWNRPGEPWQSELTFPQPGCWRVYVARGSADGELWVRVG